MRFHGILITIEQTILRKVGFIIRFISTILQDAAALATIGISLDSLLEIAEITGVQLFLALLLTEIAFRYS